MLDVTTYYGRAMQSLGKQRDLVLLFIAVTIVYGFIAVRLISLFRRGSLNSALRCLCFAIGLGWLIFVAFKAGYVRQDEHIFITWRILLLSIPVIGVVLASAPGEGAAAAVAARAGPVLLSTGLCAAILLLWTGIGWPFLWEIRVPGQYKAAFELQQRASIQALARPFPPSVTGTVDAIPWETGELIASGLDYRPRPVIQSFSSYSPRLQTLDRDHFQGPQRPETLFLRIEDIDGRLPTLATGPSLPVIGQWYDAVDTDPRGLGLILHRRSSPRGASQQAIGEAEFRLDEWITIPRPETGLVLARVTLPRTMLGRIATFLYREPLLLIVVRSASGNERTYRFIPGMAGLGFAISPLPIADPGIAAAGLLDQESFPALSERIVAFRISGSPSALRSFGIGHAAFSKVWLEPGFAAQAGAKLK
jgi:hypothetical protein